MDHFDCPQGVKFECIKCGICCGDTNEKKRHVLAFRYEVEKIASFTCQDISNFSQRISDCSPYEYELRKIDGKCIFLERNLCTIYSFRPLICKFYPFELLPKVSSKLKFNYTLECPGIGVGEEIDINYFRGLFRLARVRFGLTRGSGSSS